MQYSVGANAAHGKRRTNADKRKAVMTLLEDDEWREKYSNVEMAKLCHVSESFVRSLRTKRSEETGEPQPTIRTYTTKHGNVSKMETAKRATAGAGHRFKRRRMNAVTAPLGVGVVRIDQERIRAVCRA